jgi:hypothetical protein
MSLILHQQPTQGPDLSILVFLAIHALLDDGWGLYPFGLGPSHQPDRFWRACGHAYATSNAEVLVNEGKLVNLYSAHRTALSTTFARVACFFLDMCPERGGQKGLYTQLMAVEHGTAIIAAIADNRVYVESVHQTILVALLQQFDSLVIGKLTGHAVLDSPAA